MNSAPQASADPHLAARLRMVREQIEARGITWEPLLEALRRVPRHAFVPEALAAEAYEDYPLPIGCGQTISQPYIVACMAERACRPGARRVLEIGTGCGYQAAILAELCREVCTIEIVPWLAEQAAARLRRLACHNILTRTGDGYQGWPELAPFDAILVAASAPRIPAPLVEQLAPGGRLILPLGTGAQELVLCTRTERGLHREDLFPVRFVPMTGGLGSGS